MVPFLSYFGFCRSLILLLVFHVIPVLSTCTPAPLGSGPISSPDTLQSFLTDPQFTSLALSAPSASAYAQVFSDLNASNSNANGGSLGYTLLPSYSPPTCASACDARTGCVAFNLYFQREPSVLIGDGCESQGVASTTWIVCALWSGAVSREGAVNEGEMQGGFGVGVRGSGGWVRDDMASTMSTAPSAVVDASTTSAPTAGATGATTTTATATASGAVSGTTTTAVPTATGTAASGSANAVTRASGIGISLLWCLCTIFTALVWSSGT
ncbi:hypothetical protein B0A48_15854 [Cryoendolithus antarcticus]|uniref:Apple domain-containing protein n=1 Tax=Cryoendolithus antarcticus TaxID=1507870 RepID=A0A1V8SI98_9PEZI|nr:hypothetical protein B0A48_15854 [Cryoendolithus antarcticus]